MNHILKLYPPIAHPDYLGFRVAVYEDKDGLFTLYLGDGCFRHFWGDDLPDDLKFKIAVAKSHPKSGDNFYIAPNDTLKDNGWIVESGMGSLYCLLVDRFLMKELKDGRNPRKQSKKESR